MSENVYIAIDLKSFYASVECVERRLNPLDINLVVADPSRTEKTICLAVSPALKAFGIPGRARLFEVNERVREINAARERSSPGGKLTSASVSLNALRENSSLSLDFIIAPPRMSRYMEVSSQIYKIYLNYFSADDIHVYSVDEVFIEATKYMKVYGLSPVELTKKIIREIMAETGITATAGIGTNLYLAKIAMDIEAKHIVADEFGVRIACLDEMSYRKKLWNHKPLTDFWRVGAGYAKKLSQHGIYTMGDIARCSVGQGNSYFNEDLLYKLFGINAELLIDHAWGWEPCTLADIKACAPKDHSISSGQVLQRPYSKDEARLIVREMAESLALELMDKQLMTNQVVINIGYDTESVKTLPDGRSHEIVLDRYGRKVPKGVHASNNLSGNTCAASVICAACDDLFMSYVDNSFLIRRISIVANHTTVSVESARDSYQISLFDSDEITAPDFDKSKIEKELRRQEAILEIKKKYGKNAILRGTGYLEGSTERQRNGQIGGHKA